MTALATLIEIPGVTAAWRWQAGSTVGTLQGPRLLETSGRITTELAELGMLYLETLGTFMFFQCSVLDHRLKREEFSPAQSIVTEMKDFTVMVTANRVAVTLDSSQRPDVWELEQRMLEVENG
ncbi:MAG: hypothetical protein ACREQ3_14705 [Candidatus Binatia bacterium]